MRSGLVLGLLAVAPWTATVAGCGGSAQTAAAPAAPRVVRCPVLVARLERTAAPPTTADLRIEIRRLVAIGRTLERRYALDGVEEVVDAFAAATRFRAAATEALGDRRTTGARRLFASANTVDLRARKLAADLAGRCRPKLSSARPSGKAPTEAPSTPRRIAVLRGAAT